MNSNEPTFRKPLRLWPGVAAAVLLVLVGYVVPILAPRFGGLAMLWALGGALITAACSGSWALSFSLFSLVIGFVLSILGSILLFVGALWSFAGAR